MNPPFDPTNDLPEALNPDSTIDAVPLFGPYTELTPHARGGLGEVFRATDPDLHRTVALKCLQSRHAQNPASRQRFMLEAEVTARLEHPGVVPVYRLVTDGGQPAYAMRFIEGNTFAEEIAAYHAGPANPVHFRRLLQAFLQVCQTVAYAHSRGVIHRDLKPANIILGTFGETLVVDWGLAKVVGRSEVIRAAGEGETLVPSSEESDPSETAMGSAVGTPAYMSPEQAAGRWDIVAQPSDIYGLGAVLYTVLTGRPPLASGNWPEMQQRVQQGDFLPPRQEKPDVPGPLEAICLRAMALKPTARYASPAELAAEIERWLADEPVTVYRESFSTRARRWARHHRTMVSGATVLLVAAVLGLSFGAILLQRARVETDRQRQSAVIAQQKAEAINRFLVDDLLKQANPANNFVGDKLTVRQLLDQAADRLNSHSTLVDQPEVEAEIRAVIGHAYEYLSVFDKAEVHYERALVLLATFRHPDDPLVLALRNRYVFIVGAQGSRPDAVALASAALEHCERVFGADHQETGDAANNLAEVYVPLSRWDEAIRLSQRASRILNDRLGPTNDKTIEIDNNLGTIYVQAGRPAEGVTMLRSVVERRRQVNPKYSELGTNIGNLGGALIAVGQFDEAETNLRAAIPLCVDRLGEEHQATFSARNLLCFALECQGSWEKAEKGYLGVLSDRRRLVSQQPFIGRTLGGLARLFAKQERWTEAAPYLAELMLAGDAKSERTVEQLAPVLAGALTGTTDAITAEPILKECRDILRLRLWAGDWLIAEVSSRYGDCLRRQGKEEKYQAAEDILVAAANDVKKSVGVPTWATKASRTRVAALYHARNKPEEAAKWE